MRVLWRRFVLRLRWLVFGPPTISQDVVIAPDVRIPSPGRRRALRRESKRNEAVRKPPYVGVQFETLGEVLWILREHQWRGGLCEAVPLVTPDWVARLHAQEYTEPANLRGAKLAGVSLNCADLRDADLREADLSDSQLVQADLAGALLTETNLENAKLLNNAEASSLQAQAEHNLTINRPPYYRVAITGRNQLEWIFREHSWSGLPALRGAHQRADFSGADLRKLDLSGVDFVGAKLSGTLLIASDDERALRRRHTVNVNAGRAPYEGAKFNRHQDLLWVMRERRWQAEEAVTDPRAQINLMQADLSGASLSGMSLRYANLSGAMFTGANLRKCDLTSTTMRGADCTGANLRDATLIGSNAERARFDGAPLCGLDVRNSNLSEAILSNADLENALLINTDLRGVALRLTNLYGANLTSARIDEATTFEGAFVNRTTVMGENNWGAISLSSILWQNAHRLGDEIVPELAATASPTIAKRLRDNTRRAAMRTYRRLWVTLRAQGIDGVARRYHLRYERLRRVVLYRESKQLVFREVRFAFSLAIDAIVGFGEAPVRTFGIYLSSVFAFSTAYWKVIGPASHIHLRWPDWLLYSFVTFHGRGLFDNVASLSTAHGLLPVTALLESALGVAIEFIFVAAFTRRFLGN